MLRIDVDGVDGEYVSFSAEWPVFSWDSTMAATMTPKPTSSMRTIDDE